MSLDWENLTKCSTYSRHSEGYHLEWYIGDMLRKIYAIEKGNGSSYRRRSQTSQLLGNFYRFNIERTKRMPYKCHLSCVMSSDSGPNSWEYIRRRPVVRFKSAQFAMNRTFWLTWLVHLQNLCELQLSDWNWRTGCRLTGPKPRQRLFRWIH